MATTLTLNALTLAPSICEGRLTLETGTPVSTTDQLAKTSVYWTPYRGNRIALFDGTVWQLHAITTDLTLALGTKTAALPYDVFMYSNAGDATLEDLAWTNATTRATALTTQDGILVKSGATTRRYLGTYYTVSTTATADSGGLAGTTNVGGTRFLWSPARSRPSPGRGQGYVDSGRPSSLGQIGGVIERAVVICLRPPH